MHTISKLAAINFGVLLSLLALLEVGLRLIGIERPAFYRYDQIKGYAHRANVQGWWTQEGKAWVAINNEGFRDVNHSGKSKLGVLRGAVLGDSFSEAFQVNIDKSWWKHLEIKVNKSTDCKLSKKYQNGLEMMNFGVGGYGTGQALLTWRQNVKQKQPGFVLLAMFLGNDIEDNTPRHRQDRPVFRLNEMNKLEIDNSFRQSRNSQFRQSWLGHRLDWIVEHSRIAQLINSAKNKAAQFEISPKNRNAKKPSAPPLASPASAEGWAVTKELLKQMNTEVNAAGSKLMVVSLSSPEQVWLKKEQRPKNEFSREKNLAEILSELKVPYIALAPAMQQKADDLNTHLHGFQGQQPGIGHWNENGHELAAELLKKSLCKQ